MLLLSCHLAPTTTAIYHIYRSVTLLNNLVVVECAVGDVLCKFYEVGDQIIEKAVNKIDEWNKVISNLEQRIQKTYSDEAAAAIG